MRDSIGSLLHELGIGLRNMAQGELSLIKAEMKAIAKETKRTTLLVLIALTLIIGSLLPFFAFLTLGLGALLNGNYWLSSLIIALICASIGLFGLNRFLKKLAQQDLKFPESRKSLKQDIEVFRRSTKPENQRKAS